MIAVDGVACGVDEQHAIGVSVEGHAQRGALSHDCGSDVAEVRRAALHIDVAAIGFAGDEDDVSAEQLKELRRNGRSGAMRAVDDDAHARQRHASDLGYPLGVGLGCARGTAGRADVSAGGQVSIGLEEGLNGLFFGIEELVAVGAEQLDAVVGIGIVARADHNARRGTTLQHPPRHRWRGQDPEPDGVTTGRGDARCECVLEHRAGTTRVASDQDHGCRMRVAQASGRSTTNAQRKLWREPLVGHATNAIGAEPGTGHSGLPSASRTAGACGPS